MKKVLILLGVVAATVAPAQKLDLQFKSVTNPTSEAVYIWQDNGMRTGFATPFSEIQVKNRTIFRMSYWTLTNESRPLSSVYLGFGVSVPVVQTTQFDLSLTGGWSASFAEMTLNEPFGVRRGDGYGIGIQMRLKY